MKVIGFSRRFRVVSGAIVSLLLLTTPGVATAAKKRATFPQILMAKAQSFGAPELLVSLYEGDTDAMNREIQDRMPGVKMAIPFGPTPARGLTSYFLGVLTGVRNHCPSVLAPYAAKMSYRWPDVTFTSDGGFEYPDNEPGLEVSVEDGMVLADTFGCASPGLKRLVANGVAYVSSELLPYSKAQDAARKAAATGDSTAFFSNLMQRIVETDSRNWFFNRLDVGSVRTGDVRIGGDGNSAVVRASYSYNGGQAGWVVLNIADAKNHQMCLEYWDFQGTCRPVGDISHYGVGFLQVLGHLDDGIAR